MKVFEERARFRLQQQQALHTSIGLGKTESNQTGMLSTRLLRAPASARHGGKEIERNTRNVFFFIKQTASRNHWYGMSETG